MGENAIINLRFIRKTIICFYFISYFYFMSDTRQKVEPEIGKIYEVNHQRKGKFVVKVLRVSDEWVAGEIIEGKTNAMNEYNEKSAGEVVDMRRSFVDFYPSKIQEEVAVGK